MCGESFIFLQFFLIGGNFSSFAYCTRYGIDASLSVKQNLILVFSALCTTFVGAESPSWFDRIRGARSYVQDKLEHLCPSKEVQIRSYLVTTPEVSTLEEEWANLTPIPESTLAKIGEVDPDILPSLALSGLIISPVITGSVSMATVGVTGLAIGAASPVFAYLDADKCLANAMYYAAGAAGFATGAAVGAAHGFVTSGVEACHDLITSSASILPVRVVANVAYIGFGTGRGMCRGAVSGYRLGTSLAEHYIESAKAI